MDAGKTERFPLGLLYVLEIYEGDTVEFHEIRGAEKATTIRNQIYRLEYLQGMPENESAFFQQLVDTCNNVSIFRIKRPAVVPVHQLMTLLKNHINFFCLPTLRSRIPPFPTPPSPTNSHFLRPLISSIKIILLSSLTGNFRLFISFFF